MALVSTLGSYAGTATLVGFVGYRFSTDRRGRPDPFRWLVFAFALFEAGSTAILAPASLRLLTEAGVDGAGVVAIGDALRTAGVSCLAGLASALAGGSARPVARLVRGLRSWLVPAVVVQLAMGALTAAARPQAGPHGTVSVDGAGRWALSAHYLLFVGYTLFSLALLAAALLPQALHGNALAPRIGVWLLLTAILLGAVWSLWTLDDVASITRTGIQQGPDDPLSNLFGFTCAVLLAAGGTAAHWGDALTAPQRWWHAYQRYRALGPLWSALLHDLPDIALHPRHSPGRGPGIEFRAYRRTIEIHDACLTLRPYRQPEFETWLAEHGVDAARFTPAELEAAALAVALRNLRAGRRFDPASSAVDPGPVLDAESESAWLVEVARAFRAALVDRHLDLPDHAVSEMEQCTPGM